MQQRTKLVKLFDGGVSRRFVNVRNFNDGQVLRVFIPCNERREVKVLPRCRRRLLTEFASTIFIRENSREGGGFENIFNCETNATEHLSHGHLKTCLFFFKSYTA